MVAWSANELEGIGAAEDLGLDLPAPRTTQISTLRLVPDQRLVPDHGAITQTLRPAVSVGA